MKTITLLAIFLFCGSAIAFEGVHKENVKLPFHNKIDISASDKADLESQMKVIYENSQDPEDEVIQDISQQEQMVSDFVDVEVHWGGKSKVVDRRMNSTEAPVVAVGF